MKKLMRESTDSNTSEVENELIHVNAGLALFGVSPLSKQMKRVRSSYGQNKIKSEKL